MSPTNPMRKTPVNYIREGGRVYMTIDRDAMLPDGRIELSPAEMLFIFERTFQMGKGLMFNMMFGGLEYPPKEMKL